MDKQKLDAHIEEMTKSILSYCTARTSNHFDAEDLAQDIIVELYKSVDNLKNPEAFYGFMWAIAGNVYKQWCREKANRNECELTDDLVVEDPLVDDEDSELYLLRRELALLSEKYRKAVILYYVEQKSCSEISNHLSISESMVKYLLFKSRQILKEGMSMERNYGSQSYNPKKLSLMFWGMGANYYYQLCDSKIAQNILFACYHDRLTAEQISLEIGVALPYMEDKLAELCKYDVLKKEGNRYYTNIVIFTKEFMTEVKTKTARMRARIADILQESITEHEPEIRNLGFYGADMGNNAFAWQMTCFALYYAIIVILQNKMQVTYPVDKFGTKCFVWGVESGEENMWESLFGFGISNVRSDSGDYIQFMDFPINGEMVHHYRFNQQNVTNVFADVAKGKTEQFSENDRVVAADMVRKGYILSDEKGLRVNVPVFTDAQHQVLKSIFAETAKKIAEEAESMMGVVTKIMKNHMPSHLKKIAGDMTYLRLFEDAISAPVALLHERKYLMPYDGDGLLPTTYIMLR